MLPQKALIEFAAAGRHIVLFLFLVPASLFHPAGLALTVSHVDPPFLLPRARSKDNRACVLPLIPAVII